ncbi:hypothetical protein RhiirC2_797036 [Rhizophagus irregularis]|uniref:Uncharacterized protein n=1 Tax=Rhizophagus irregularis TaxID=588596 RepID=A0A2N1M8M6_9GLOM|nr:hypothetical protein RhiirC2_797036 [Rhizophagus irregularis]
MRKEDNTTMNLKIIAFFPKNPSVPKWIPDFASGDVVRFTGKFSLNEELPHDDILELMLNLTKDNLPISSISVFFIGYVIRQVQDDDDLFKSIKLNVNEFVGKGNVADKINIKCRYLKAIDNKVKKIRKNSNVMMLGEMIFVDSECQIEIQDINFITMMNTNIGNSTDDSISSLYT